MCRLAGLKHCDIVRQGLQRFRHRQSPHDLGQCCHRIDVHIADYRSLVTVVRRQEEAALPSLPYPDRDGKRPGDGSHAAVERDLAGK